MNFEMRFMKFINFSNFNKLWSKSFRSENLIATINDSIEYILRKNPKQAQEEKNMNTLNIYQDSVTVSPFESSFELDFSLKISFLQWLETIVLIANNSIRKLKQSIQKFEDAKQKCSSFDSGKS